MTAARERPTRWKQGWGWAVPVPVAAVVTLAVAACGSGGSSTSAASTHHQATDPAGDASGAVTIKAGRSPFGAVITNGNGRAVYLFEKDAGTKPTCYGPCANVWLPVLSTGAPLAGSGVTATLLGTVTRTGGGTQVTYAGHPLYYFATDKQAGDFDGEGSQTFGGGWDLVSPTGTKVEKPGS